MSEKVDWGIKLAKSYVWVTSVCPKCSVLNWFSLGGFHTDIFADVDMGKCHSCKGLFWIDEGAQKWFEQDLNDHADYYKKEIAARGGLEIALQDRKCITGLSPIKHEGKPGPIL